MHLAFDEKRRTPRVPTKLDAAVLTDRSALFRCVILDINVYGARLLVGDETPPERFHLIDLLSSVAYEARIMWRHAPMVGTRFLATWNLAAADAPQWLKDARGDILRADAEERGIRLVWSAPPT